MIYLCRHGETEFNRQHRLQGRMESELTPLGIRQAAAMADLLRDLITRNLPVRWRVISSPLLRARATANIIASRLGFSVELDERLVEISVGQWEGRLRADLARDHPEIAQDPEWLFRAPGGETYEQVSRRVSEWLTEQSDELDRRLIVVSHGVTGRLLRGVYAGLDRSLAIRQDVPQDAIYRLSDGQLDRLECEPCD
jgi:broad specificity phosphatase PhoE